MCEWNGAMADHYTYRVGKKVAGSSRTSAERESRKAELKVHPAYEQSNLGNAMNDKTESKRKGRPKTENQALKDIPLPLMNQWKDEFKAHSRVKCPNSGCWLEFPSIYGLKYHFQRCQGGAVVEKRTFPCLYCEAVFTSKTQLEKHCLWNHLDRPLPAASPPAENKVQKATSKGAGKKRKQKTPKKFTGEQPSISGTFGLKATPEEQWQRIINEKGEVACPTCGMITRKTVLGLKKHMEVCQKGCVATFSSLMGYQYHQKRCGKQPSELEKPVFTCPHCGKAYKSKAGHDYHIRSEHPATPPEQPELQPEPSPVEDFERTPSGRIRRTSAQVAVFHLQEIAEDELAKDWTKRRMKDDLVPETKQ
ncbi:Zinc finger protein, partial [Ophiophagus hannah]